MNKLLFFLSYIGIPCILGDGRIACVFWSAKEYLDLDLDFKRDIVGNSITLTHKVYDGGVKVVS